MKKPTKSKQPVVQARAMRPIALDKLEGVTGGGDTSSTSSATCRKAGSDQEEY